MGEASCRRGHGDSSTEQIWEAFSEYCRRCAEELGGMPIGLSGTTAVQAVFPWAFGSFNEAADVTSAVQAGFPWASGSPAASMHSTPLGDRSSAEAGISEGPKEPLWPIGPPWAFGPAVCMKVSSTSFMKSSETSCAHLFAPATRSQQSASPSAARSSRESIRAT